MKLTTSFKMTLVFYTKCTIPFWILSFILHTLTRVRTPVLRVSSQGLQKPIKRWRRFRFCFFSFVLYLNISFSLFFPYINLDDLISGILYSSRTTFLLVRFLYIFLLLDVDCLLNLGIQWCRSGLI